MRFYLKPKALEVVLLSDPKWFKWEWLKLQKLVTAIATQGRIKYSTPQPWATAKNRWGTGQVAWLCLIHMSVSPNFGSTRPIDYDRFPALNMIMMDFGGLKRGSHLPPQNPKNLRITRLTFGLWELWHIASWRASEILVSSIHVFSWLIFS